MHNYSKIFKMAKTPYFTGFFGVLFFNFLGFLLKRERNLPTKRIIFVELVRAKFLPNALPKTVSAAIIELTKVERNAPLMLGSSDMSMMEIATPLAPLTMLQISPTTSVQIEETLSAFFTSLIDASTALLFFSFLIRKKGFMLLAATATPITSKTTLTKIRSKTKMSSTAKLALINKRCDMIENIKQRRRETVNSSKYQSFPTNNVFFFVKALTLMSLASISSI